MNSFNTIYYSFSPQVADYERHEPWLQTTVKAGLYPLFGILMTSEKAYTSVAGGELGAIAAGAVASTLIGAVYLWPAAISTRLQRKFGMAAKISLAVVCVSSALIAFSMATNNTLLLSVFTSLFVVSVASSSAIAAGKLVRIGYKALRKGKY